MSTGWRLARASVLATMVPYALSAQTEVKTLRLSGLSGEARGSYAGSWDQTPGTQRRATVWERALLLALEGSVMHPNVASFRIEAQPLFSSLDRTLLGVDSTRAERDTNRLMGSIQVELFRNSLLGGSLFATRDRAKIRPEFGAEERATYTEWGGTFEDRNPLLPATISYQNRRERRTVAFFAPGDQAVVDDHTGLLRYQAENSKMSLVGERIDVRRAARIPGEVERREQDLLQYLGLFRHRMSWGKGSVLSSQLRYLKRQAKSSTSNLSWSETATLRQSRTVRSSLGTGVTQVWFPSGQGVSTWGHYHVTYQPTRSFTLAGRTEARQARFGDVRTSTYDAGPTARVALSLPAGMRWSTTVSARYRWHRRSTPTTRVVEMNREAHRVGADGVVRLDRPFVDPTSVAVFNVAGDRLFQEGVDYRLVLNGSYLEIHILPGSLIEVGMEVLVDYLYELVEGGSEDRILFYDTSLRIGPLILSALRQRVEALGPLESLGPGAARVEDRSEWAAAASESLGRWSLGASISGGRYRRNGYDIRTRSLAANVGAYLGGNLSASTSASYRDNGGTVSPYRSRQATQMLRWFPHPAVRLIGSASWWEWRQEGRDEEFLSAAATLELGRRSRKVQVRYDFTDWRNSSRWKGHRIYVGVSQALGGF